MSTQMPKVTLLGNAGNTFVLGFGRKTFLFEAGRAQKVPVPVALHALKKVTPKGKPVFSVTDMPALEGRDGPVSAERLAKRKVQKGKQRAQPVQGQGKFEL